MSKYIYWQGKIYTEDSFALLKLGMPGAKGLYPHLDLDFSYKEFENFEEILEVGDLVVDSETGACFAGLISSHVRAEGTFLINDGDDWIDSVSLSDFNEIYKKNANTFVRVAHKENIHEENEKWVID